jgi:hypothetical protein
MLKRIIVMGWLSTWLALTGCDAQRIAELEEGVATEADVKARFGEPEKVWDGAAGLRVFEYNRQPNGTQNFMISIGADGKMTALRQVLNAANFAKITPGMALMDVRRMLGQPMKVTRFHLKNETHHDWRWADGPNVSDRKIFTVVVDPQMQVVSTASTRDPEIDIKSP